jgi:hypothetical protein
MTIPHILIKFAGVAFALLLLALNTGSASIRPPAGVKPAEKYC